MWDQRPPPIKPLPVILSLVQIPSRRVTIVGMVLLFTTGGKSSSRRRRSAIAMIVSSAEVEISWVYRPSEVVVVLFVLKLHGARVGERGSVHGEGVGALFVRALRQMEERRRRRILRFSNGPLEDLARTHLGLPRHPAGPSPTRLR